MFKQRYYSLLLFSYFTLFATQGYGFNIDGDKKWPEANTTFHVNIPGADGLWNDAFETAMFRWGEATDFTYSIVRDSFVDPCQNPSLVTPKNGVKFDSTICGDAFGSTTLAINQKWTSGTTIIQSGIVFNSNKSWNVYSGSWNFSIKDFRRVAVHELGHALGLSHENRITSIMNSFSGDLETPQQDDVNGVAALYGDGSTTSFPDLVVISPSVSDTTLIPGQSFTINATVKNQGAGSSNSTILRYYRSTNDFISSFDTELGTDLIPALSPNATSPQSLTTSAPSTEGTFWVGACVDTVSGESSTSNQCSTGVQISIDDLNDSIDTDGDGMSDTFEVANGFNPFDASDAGLDADNDGLTNLDEFIAGSAPNDANSPVVDTNVVLASAVLPSSRSVTVGSIATAFATIINIGSAAATNCWLSPITSIPADFFFQTTNPATNALSGIRNTAIDIAVGVAQTFVFGFTPTAAFGSTEVQIRYRCANAKAAGVINGLNSLLLSASDIPIPDIVALGATVNNDGIVHIPGTTDTGFFSVASVNVGASATLRVSVNTGSATLPIVTSLCETNPATGVCINPTTPTTGEVTLTINANETPAFAVFVAGTEGIALDAAFKRIFLRFKDASGVTRGSTSVAVQIGP